MLVARYILEIKTEGVPWTYDTPSFAAGKASLLGACPQQGVGMKVKNKP